MMEKEHKCKFNNQRGSATIEAVIGFSVFLLTIFTILGMANFCRAQMLVSAAVDTAAKEMSQYAYFYEMSGLQKFEEQLDANAQLGKSNINDVIGTVDKLYTSINGAVEQTVQEKTEIENAMNSGDLTWEDIESSMGNLSDASDTVVSDIETVSNAIGDIANDPMLYMRSVVALIGSESMEAVKRAVAIPLAKSFVKKHFGTDPNKTLENLGIVDGMDGLNFKLTNIFADKNHREIEITVLYKIRLLQVFDWVVLEANVSKVAVCRAWLAGDSVRVKASASGNADLGTVEEPSTDASGDAETTDPADPSNPTDPADSSEPTEETKPQVDTEGSYWYLGDGGYTGHEDAGVIEAFKALFKETYNIDQDEMRGNYQYVPGKDEEGNYNDTAYMWDYDTNPDPKDYDFAFVMTKLHVAEQDIADGDLPEGTTMFTYVLYVPENIPEEDYKALQDAINQAMKDYYLYVRAYPEQGFGELSFDVDIVRAGGNYDYEGEGGE